MDWFGSWPETGADPDETGAAADGGIAGAADSNGSLESVPAAVAEALPTAEPIAAAQFSAPAEDPAATAADLFVPALAGAGAAETELAGAGGGETGTAEATTTETGTEGARTEGAGTAEDPAATAVDLLVPALADAGGASGRAGNGDWFSKIVGGPRLRSWKIATAAGAAAVIVVGLVIVAANAGTMPGHQTRHKASPKKADAISVVSVSPGNGSTGINGASPITVTYSGPVTKGTPLPTLSPAIAGSWQVSKDEAIFTPQVGFREDTHVTVNIPAPAGTATTAATSFSFSTGQYSMLRLDQLLSQLGYIPVSWTPTQAAGYVPATDARAQLAAAYDPPAGTFSFDSGYPAALTSQWSVGTNNEITDGAIRTFEFDHNLNMDGVAGPRVWAHLLTAIAKGDQNQHGYTYVWVTQAGNEHLVLYHNGQVAITSPVNTGIAASPTPDGTFPVYLRYQVTQMIGNNPDGSRYDDTVYWVSYFNGGDAVHAFPRGSYGWYQSLGCVELPSYGSTAEDVWNLITYGTLVTVAGPVA